MEKRMRNFKGHEMGNVKNYQELINRAVKLHGDKVAFEYKKDPESKTPEYIKHTFKEYKDELTALGNTLINMGCNIVSLIGNNRYEWCTSYMAVAAGGMVIVPLDKSLPDGEIKSLIRRSNSDTIIYDSKYEKVFEEIREENNTNLKHYICMDKLEDENVLFYGDLVEQGKQSIANDYNKFDNVKIDDNAMSIMLFTSGTTDTSKGVMLSQYNVCSNIDAMPHFVMMYETDTLLSFLPLHHTFESTITFIYACLYCGATMAFCDGLKHISSNLKEYHITVFVGVPLMLEAMYKKIMKNVEKQGKTKLIKSMMGLCNFLLALHIDIRRKVFKPILDGLGGKLRLILYGGAATEKSIILGLSSFGISVNQGYGLTETSPVIAAETDHYKRPGAAGLVMCNDEIKIIDQDESGIGEIVVKGPNIMLGYYENEEETNRVLKDGWFYTGDLGYFDKDGFLFVTGRKKDVIVLKNGKNVFPQELEFLISTLPFVKEEIVYGKPTDDNDYVISAKIVYDSDAMKELYPDKQEADYKNIIWEEIKKLNMKVPNFRHIREIDITTEPLIKTTTQKVKRKEEIAEILKDNK